MAVSQKPDMFALIKYNRHNHRLRFFGGAAVDDAADAARLALLFGLLTIFGAIAGGLALDWVLVFAGVLVWLFCWSCIMTAAYAVVCVSNYLADNTHNHMVD